MKADWERKHKTGNEEKPLRRRNSCHFSVAFRFSMNCTGAL
ncbi:hypothetical protein CDS [Bradyrhizobium sp.]|nr:hypothetical protein CDS [Bradyrhizobium sp.]